MDLLKVHIWTAREKDTLGRQFFPSLCVLSCSPSLLLIYISLSYIYIYIFIVIPPIIFFEGLASNNHVFMKNLGTILVNAIIGTVLSTLAVGYTMYAVAVALGIAHFDILDGLVFGAVISAIDPVAVLSVFEYLNVNTSLREVTSGESLLNDAVAIVLYRALVALAYQDNLYPSNELDNVVIIFFRILATFLVGMCTLVC